MNRSPSSGILRVFLGAAPRWPSPETILEGIGTAGAGLMTNMTRLSQHLQGAHKFETENYILLHLIADGAYGRWGPWTLGACKMRDGRQTVAFQE